MSGIRFSIPAGLALFDSGAAKGEADVSTEEVATATLSVGQAPKSELGIDSSRSETGSSAGAATPGVPPTEAASVTPAGPAAVAEVAPDRIAIRVSPTEVPPNRAIEPMASASRPEELRYECVSPGTAGGNPN